MHLSNVPLKTLLNTRLRSVGRLFALMVLAVTTGHAVAAEPVAEAPLVIGQRVVHVFRAPLGAYTPAERAEGARQRILKAMESSGEGWTSIKRTEQGVAVDLDRLNPALTLDGLTTRSYALQSASGSPVGTLAVQGTVR